MRWPWKRREPIDEATLERAIRKHTCSHFYTEPFPEFDWARGKAKFTCGSCGLEVETGARWHHAEGYGEYKSPPNWERCL